MAAAGQVNGVPKIAIRGLHKSFGHLKVLREVDLLVEPGEVVVIIGPSGSGKSTLLRCISRLERFEAGVIEVDGVAIAAGRHAGHAGRSTRTDRRRCAARSAWCSSRSTCSRT